MPHAEVPQLISTWGTKPHNRRAALPPAQFQLSPGRGCPGAFTNFTLWASTPLSSTRCNATTRKPGVVVQVPAMRSVHPPAAAAVARQWAAVATSKQRARIVRTTSSPSNRLHAGPRTVAMATLKPPVVTVPVHMCRHAVVALGDARPQVRHLRIPSIITWTWFFRKDW